MSRLRLIGSEAFRSMGANLSTTVAATMTVLIGMFLLGVFIALGTWVLSWSDHVKRQLEVKVDFCIGAPFDDCKKAATAKQINAVRVYLAQQKQAGVVREYSFVTRAEALRRMQKTTPDLVASVTANPLPPTYEVTPQQAEKVKELANDIRLKHFAGVEQIRDGKQTSKRILQVATWIWRVFLVAVVILLVTSTLLIGNTIRLSIFSRRREIEVMKLVGATNWFVRGPFMLEGLLCGLIGSVAAIVLLLLGRIAWNAIANFDSTSASDVHAMAFSLNALILAGMGLVIGAVGAGMTMHRFLRI